MTDSKQTVLGYIGLGNMGGPMALRLARAGYRLQVYGRNKERLKPAIAAGAVECATAEAVARQSDIVFVCLTDAGAVDAVVFGPNGIAAGARSGTLLVDMSTISPDDTITMAARLRGATGMRWIDAPISGGTIGAEAGTLSIFVGASTEDFELLHPVLQNVGRNISRMGALGLGQTTKLINQILICTSVAMLAEACGLAERIGLDVQAIPKALAGGRADSTCLQVYWPRLAERDYTPLSTITSILKDIDIIQKAGRRVGANLPLTSLVREYNQLLVNSGHAGEDLTALARLFGQPRDKAAQS